MVKIPREEIAYNEFIEEMLRGMKEVDPKLTDVEVEELRAESQEPAMRVPIIQGLNVLLWKQDEVRDLAILNCYRNMLELILATIPAVDRGEETKKIIGLINELIEAEDTEEEILTIDELNELAGEDED